VFTVMARAHWHTFQLLTKRHGRMRALMASDAFRSRVDTAADGLGLELDNSLEPVPWPAPNVWLGVSAEDQRWWDIRVPALMATPAAVRFVSAEPLLGPIDMGLDRGKPAPDWLIIGAESGCGARPMAVEWVCGMLSQCQRPGVPTVPFVKQLGSVTGRDLSAGPKGEDWDQWPQDLRVREFPAAGHPAATR
jgi:protein gp37